MIYLLVTAVVLLVILLYLVIDYGFLVPAPRGLPILLYHDVSASRNDKLTISVDRFEKHLSYLKRKGYTAISFAELAGVLDGDGVLPEKPVLITFDDAYVSQYELAYPLLEKYGFKATFFLPVAYIGRTDEWVDGQKRIIGYDVVREMAGSSAEFGLHTFRHGNYGFLSPEEMEADVALCLRTLSERGCPYFPVFAYPYGTVPKDPVVRRRMEEIFGKHGIAFAVRIKSRMNALPPRNVYDLRRIGLSGRDSFLDFRIKLKKGRRKLF